ncbi:hypothetical protein K431DRAFT_287939 [Polychaeton citri CBS 116435]|uniref:EH domain-containing protein n=1 Tax=Polychaeton citri CBS 116435 TaxID=1314669 RepID=A0A9P4UL36_9PEZI|nr:hypothetical protein K431DRAFT_287939 [Polychaeton citri CBS 116435]
MSRAPSRASSYASQQQDASAGQNASLLGAAHAFAKPIPLARNPLKSYAGPNGALTAAALAGGSQKKPSPTNPNTKNTSYSPSTSPAATSGSNAVFRAPPTDSGISSSFLAPDHSDRPRHSRSPSQQAAMLAASRFSPQPLPATSPPKRAQPKLTLRRTMKPVAPPKPRRLSRYGSEQERQQSPAVKSKPIASFASVFEPPIGGISSSQQRFEPIVVKPERPLSIRSPKPFRASEGITSVFQMDLHPTEDSLGSPASPTSEAPTSISSHDDRYIDMDDDDDAYVSAPENALRSPTSTSRHVSHTEASPSPHTYTTLPSPQTAKEKPRQTSPIRPRASTTAPIRIPAIANKGLSPPSHTKSSPQSAQSLAAQWHLLNPRRPTPLTSGEELASALVASSLASSRAASPHKSDMPLSTSKKHYVTSGFARTPSPKKKGMRHTLREQGSESSDSEEEIHPYHKHRKKRLVRKHPHKHHEGDRKRWRDALNERERKRYEGIWAANKGLICSFNRQEQIQISRFPDSKDTIETQGNVSEEVSNIVARDIWIRSRLPEHALEVIWDLVDSRAVGRLLKEEFVVGMWLVDQRLKGRKLPTKVGDSVWRSVIGIGIKVRK